MNPDRLWAGTRALLASDWSQMLSSWFTLLGTALGGLIGILSTLLTERGRFKREIVKLDREARRQLYADFLTADAAAHETMRAQTYSKSNDSSIRVRVNDAFAESQLYPARWKMTVLAPSEVVERSDNAFRELRDIRDVLADGHSIKSPAYKDAHFAHANALRALRDNMRGDLGNRPLAYDESEPHRVVASQDEV
jgi:hypothetical protein